MYSSVVKKDICRFHGTSEAHGNTPLFKALTSSVCCEMPLVVMMIVVGGVFEDVPMLGLYCGCYLGSGQAVAGRCLLRLGLHQQDRN